MGTDDEMMRATLAAVAPGTALRDALERILRGRTGALVVLGNEPQVEEICSGGFALDVEFTSTGLRELAKMDGAIVVNHDVTRILRAATQLVPDPSIETVESGTRHRTAERVAKQTGVPVVSVSQSMSIVAIYAGHQRHVLEGSPAVLSKAEQALRTLERYAERLVEVDATLSALEIEDLVTLRDVALLLQRLEMVRRIHAEIDGYVVELGTDGRLVDLQLEELTSGVRQDQAYVIADYLVSTRSPCTVEEVSAALSALPAATLVDPLAVARCLDIPVSPETLDNPVSPRGYRLLARIPRLPGIVIDRLVERFDTLQKLLAATLDELMQVEGVGEARARAIREGMSRLAESSILERYV